MVIKIYGYYISTCTRRVAVIAKERNIPYELVSVDLPSGEPRQPPHVEHHPFGQIPYMEHDGFELFESRAICRYLAELGSGPTLIPTEPKALAKFEQAASIEYAQFDPIGQKILKETFLKKVLGQPIDEERVKPLLPVLESKLDVYEAILSKQKYLAGDEVTLADLFHLPYCNFIFDDFKYGDLDRRPNVRRWWKDISSRPAWQAVKDSA
ncbi:glutathione S-transferase-like protein [Russula brevipes]|nr:glutathione S-transferase-like protein [Russula brevipes]